MTSVQTSRKINKEVSGKPKAGCIVSMQYIPRDIYLSFSLCTPLYVGKQPMLTSPYLSDVGSGMPCSVKSNHKFSQTLQVFANKNVWTYIHSLLNFCIMICFDNFGTLGYFVTEEAQVKISLLAQLFLEAAGRVRSWKFEMKKYEPD